MIKTRLTLEVTTRTSDDEIGRRRRLCEPDKNETGSAVPNELPSGRNPAAAGACACRPTALPAALTHTSDCPKNPLPDVPLRLPGFLLENEARQSSADRSGRFAVRRNAVRQRRRSLRFYISSSPVGLVRY